MKNIICCLDHYYQYDEIHINKPPSHLSNTLSQSYHEVKALYQSSQELEVELGKVRGDEKD